MPMKKISTLLLSATALACHLAYAQQQPVNLGDEPQAQVSPPQPSAGGCGADVRTNAPSRSGGPLRVAASCAIDTNPDVAAKYQAFQASREEVEVARGGFLPRVDLNSEAARKWDQVTTRQPEGQSVTVTGLSVTATQLLWDGFSTQSQVDRFTHTSRTRYFEFLDATEQVALETVRAHADVARALALVRLAEENLQKHQTLDKRQAAGSLGGADSRGNAKQTEARRILAQSNLYTERSNLHDVMERYRRIVGMVPSTSLTIQDSSETVRSIQDSTKSVAPGTVIEQAVHSSPQVRAAIANLQAARAQAQESEAAYQPKVEARVRSGVGQNMDGIADKKSETKAGVALNWNLYNGGSDQAKTRQQAKLIEQAISQRDRACRDARQTAAIASNDVTQLTDQVRFYTSNVSASQAAWDAIWGTYQQGTADSKAKTRVIDVLNAENEVYAAKRAKVNAEHDLFIAKARVRAATGQLLGTLALTRGTDDASSAPDSGSTEEPTQCPVLVDPPVIPALGVQLSPVTADRTVDIGGSNLVAGMPGGSIAQPINGANNGAGGTPPSTQAVSDRLSAWVAAWQAKDVKGYLAFYDKSFSPAGVTRDKWLENRSRLLRKDGPIQIQITNEKTRVINADTVEITFNQSYSSNNFSDSTQKTLVWKRVKGTWVITQEKSKR
jgi:adhesin transport system outer membrane protein